MKVLHVSPSFFPAFVYGGPTVSVYNLCCSLLRTGCEVSVLTTDANGPTAVLDVNTTCEVKVDGDLRVRYCHRVADVSVSPALLRLLPTYISQADVVHLTSVYSFPTIPTLALSRVFRRPVVWSPRGMLQRWEGTTHAQLKRFWETVCRIVSARDMVLHVTSEQEALESQARMPGAKAVVIPNGIEIPADVSRNDAKGELRLMFLGRIHPKKGIENLLYAAAGLNTTLAKSWSLTIAGDGEAEYLKSIQNLVMALSLSSRVKLIGSVLGEAKRKLFENSDVLVVPSYTENFGLVVAEGLAHGVPVIASSGTPWSRINEIGCGLWTNNTPEELAQAISRISEMPLRDMGKRGRDWMIREFSWDPIATQMSRLYESIQDRPSVS